VKGMAARPSLFISAPLAGLVILCAIYLHYLLPAVTPQLCSPLTSSVVESSRSGYYF
jgi:hypothetical protein